MESLGQLTEADALTWFNHFTFDEEEPPAQQLPEVLEEGAFLYAE